MSIYDKRVRLLGREPIPKFSRRACLCWAGWAEETLPGVNQWPEIWSMYNIAAFAFYPRHGNLNVPLSPPYSTTFWSHRAAGVHSNMFGQSWVNVPADAEWFSVAYITPPASLLATGPYPEEWFWVKWELAL